MQICWGTRGSMHGSAYLRAEAQSACFHTFLVVVICIFLLATIESSRLARWRFATMTISAQFLLTVYSPSIRGGTFFMPPRHCVGSSAGEQGSRRRLFKKIPA